MSPYRKPLRPLVCHVHIHSRGPDGINQLRGKSEKIPRFVKKVLPVFGGPKQPLGRAEARHAAFIREQLSYGSFADSTVVSAQGLDTSRTPAQVLTLVAPFIVETLNGSNLPTS